MILIHRVTPFVLGLLLAAGFLFMAVWPGTALVMIVLMTLACVLLLGRLIGWEIGNFQFWNFVGTPLVFIVSSAGLFLFFENMLEKLLLAAVVALGVFLYTEHVFTYRHTPAAYKTYALEHLSLVLHILSIFFISAVSHGLILFLQVPLFILAPIFFVLTLFVVYSMFWVSKIEHARAISYALAGAVLLTELFLASSYLPTGFYTNAAVMALGVYIFLGLSRAHVLEKLTKTVLVRYLTLGSVLLLVALGSARWI